MSALPTAQELHETLTWLLSNNPSENPLHWNPAERQKRYAILQRAADACSGDTYKSFLPTINAGHPPSLPHDNTAALAYLRQATNHAINEVHNFPVTRGLALWHFYNMGYVIKTPHTTFGIDLHFHGAERLADSLDFLLVSHEHQDHWTSALLDRMADAKKPLITRFHNRGTRLSQPTNLQFPHASVNITIGDHHFGNNRAINDMLIFDLQFPIENHRSLRLIHCGDNSNLDKLPLIGPTPVDAFIFHIKVGLSAPAAFDRLQPRFLLPAHILELAHPIDQYRWSFADALDVTQSIPQNRVRLLTWGERLDLPAP